MNQSSMDERMRNYKILLSLLEEFGLLDKVIELNGSYMDHFNYVKDYITKLYDKEN